VGHGVRRAAPGAAVGASEPSVLDSARSEHRCSRPGAPRRSSPRATPRRPTCPRRTSPSAASPDRAPRRALGRSRYGRRPPRGV